MLCSKYPLASEPIGRKDNWYTNRASLQRYPGFLLHNMCRPPPNRFGRHFFRSLCHHKMNPHFSPRRFDDHPTTFIDTQLAGGIRSEINATRSSSICSLLKRSFSFPQRLCSGIGSKPTDGNRLVTFRLPGCPAALFEWIVRNDPKSLDVIK